MKRFAKGFTLAETMIVIVVLGIIATLTIPALVNKNKESVAKTKLRKAMAAYESALNKMIIENDLKDNGPLTTWAGNLDNGCANSTQYFKKVQGDGCIFKTSDGVWWNISDIERPLIAFKQDDLTTEKANAQNDYSAFVLVGRFGNDGSLRVDDLAYETANSIKDNSNYESYDQVSKLYNFILGKKNTVEICDFACKITKYRNTQCRGEYYDYRACVFSNDGSSYHYYDENGNYIFSAYECSGNGDNCSYSEKSEYDSNGRRTIEYRGCDGNGNNCSNSTRYKYDDNGNFIWDYGYCCDGNGENCEECYIGG